MSNAPSRFERRQQKIEEKIDARIAAIDKAFEVNNERPHGKRQLSESERIQYFASLPDERKMELWDQMDEAERNEIRQGLNKGG